MRRVLALAAAVATAPLGLCAVGTLDARVEEAAHMALVAQRHAEAAAAEHARLLQMRLAQGADAAAGSRADSGAEAAVAASAERAAAAAESFAEAAAAAQERLATGAAVGAGAGAEWRQGNGHDIGQVYGKWYMQNGAWMYGAADKHLECEVCVSVVNRLIQRLGDQFSRASIATEAGMLCPRLHWVLRSGCEFVVTRHRDVVTDLIMKLIEPVDICKHLTLCYPDAWDLAHMAGVREYATGPGAMRGAGSPAKLGVESPYRAMEGHMPDSGYGAMRHPGLAPPVWPNPFQSELSMYAESSFTGAAGGKQGEGAALAESHGTFVPNSVDVSAVLAAAGQGQAHPTAGAAPAPAAGAAAAAPAAAGAAAPAAGAAPAAAAPAAPAAPAADAAAAPAS